MKYRKLGEKVKEEISAIGFGCLRLPVDDQGDVDQKVTEEMMDYAVEHGVNYFDTGYTYCNSESESICGQVLKKHRSKVYYATKSPVSMLEKEEDFQRIFDEQLEKMQTDYFDFYLLHGLNRDYWENKVLKWDLLSKMEEIKKQGKARYIGFSYHDDFDTLKMILDYFDDWDVCQVQMNYADINNQATLKGIEYANSKGIGVIIMEPLRGGRLANPTERMLEVLPKGKSPVEYGLDFLWDNQNISLVLSGMSSLQQVKDNIEYAKRSSINCLSNQEREALIKTGEVFLNSALVGCTKCAYCMPCPAGIDIPKTLEIYNQTATVRSKMVQPEYDKLEVKASQCLKCHHCESMCPQHLSISNYMQEISESMEK